MPLEQFSLLVIEDDPDQLHQAQTFFSNVHCRFTLIVSYARTYEEALALLPKVDAVASNLFFPTDPTTRRPLPNGYRVMLRCLESRKPVVFLTNEVDRKRERIIRQLCDRTIPYRIEVLGLKYVATPHVGSPSIWLCESKPWQTAFLILLFLKIGLDIGAFDMDYYEGFQIANPDLTRVSNEAFTLQRRISDRLLRRWEISFEFLCDLEGWAEAFASPDRQSRSHYILDIEQEPISQALHNLL